MLIRFYFSGVDHSLPVLLVSFIVVSSVCFFFFREREREREKEGEGRRRWKGVARCCLV